jgi:hypothetical protein
VESKGFPTNPRFYHALVLFSFVLGCQSTTLSPTQLPLAQKIEGHWTGTWDCETTGHSGKLRCHLIHVENNRYQAKYTGTYMAILPFWYTVEMEINCSSQDCKIKAEADLGWLGGGHYVYDGTIIGDSFKTNYTSKHHNGTFNLQHSQEFSLATSPR